MHGLLTTTDTRPLVPGHELLPYRELLDVEGGLLLLETPRRQQSFWRTPALALGCAWQVRPRNVELLDTGELRDLARLHEHMLTSLPVGAAVQTLTTMVPATTVPAWEAQRQACHPDDLLVAQRAAIAGGLPHHDPGVSERLREVRTLVTLRLPLTTLDPSLRRRLGHLGLSGSARTAHLLPLLTEALRDCETARLGIDESLRAAGHVAHRLSGLALGQALAEALAPDSLPVVPVLDPEQSLHTQLLTRPLHQLEAGGFGWGTAPDTLVSQMVSLHHAPPRTYPGLLCATRAPEDVTPLALWNIWDGPITIAVNVAVTPASTEELGRKVKLFFAKKNAAENTENKEIAKELEAMESQYFTQGGQNYWGRVHVALWGEAAAVPAGLAAIKRRATRVHLPLEVEAGAIGATLWLQTLPLNFDPAWPADTALQRAQALPLPHLANLLTLYGCAAGTATASILFLNARGEAAPYDPFDNLTNANVAVAGTSGAGKTYLVGHVLDQLMPQHPDVLLLDPLRNFRHLCAAHGGTFLPLTYDHPPCFNPFYGPGTEDHQAFATGFLAECASGGLDPISAEEFSVLGSAITYGMYGWDAQRGEQTLSPFVEEVLQDGQFARSDREARRIGEQVARKLLMFYGDRAYAKFVDGRNTFALTPGLTLVELTEFDRAPALQGLLFSALIHLARQFFEDPARLYTPKYFIADECWRWLTDPRTAGIIATIVRTYRNMHASSWFVSQRLEDFNTVTGKVVLDLTESKFFLKHPSSQFAAVKTLFQLTDAEMALVAQAAKHEDWSSGFLRLGPGEGGLVRVVSDPFTRLLMTQETAVARRRDALTAQYDGQIRRAVAHMLSEGMAA